MAPDVRLAWHPEGDRTLKEMGMEESPQVRLAWPSGGNGGPTQRADMMIQGDRPALLVSYVYLGPFLKNRHRYNYRDWVMDSGAFSAHNSGAVIALQDYIDTCKRLIAEDLTLTEVFSLDVIGDWKASLRNTEEMWRQGVPAIPTFHPGEPWSALVAMARDYPKIAIGGVVGWPIKKKMAFVGQVFARTWPKAIHGLGMSSTQMLNAFPFHSVDATNWEIGPCKFGRWQSFGQMSVRGSKQNLRSEVEWYLKLERQARARWRSKMADIPGYGTPALSCRPGTPLDGSTGPTMRLAYAETGTTAAERIDTALGPPPAPVVRLAAQQSSDAQIARSGLEIPPPSPTLRLAVAGGEIGKPRHMQAVSGEPPQDDGGSNAVD